jgi:hypothetical protein
MAPPRRLGKRFAGAVGNRRGRIADAQRAAGGSWSVGMPATRRKRGNGAFDAGFLVILCRGGSARTEPHHAAGAPIVRPVALEEIDRAKIADGPVAYPGQRRDRAEACEHLVDAARVGSSAAAAKPGSAGKMTRAVAFMDRLKPRARTSCRDREQTPASLAGVVMHDFSSAAARFLHTTECRADNAFAGRDLTSGSRLSAITGDNG